MTDRRERQHGGGFAARLREVMSSYGSAGTLARSIERSEGAVRKWLRGESEPNVTDLRSLCEATRTSIDWLVTGNGPREAGPVVQELPATYEATPAAARDLDQALLERVLAAMEAELERAGIALPPAKRSVMAVMLYEQSLERGQVDAEAVARLVRLAG
jgi:transcriptional regulator with XRE-family HTH domain